jgi:hypothetical protein
VTLARQIADELAAVIAAENFPALEQVHARLNLDATPPSIDVYPGEPFFSTDAQGFDGRGAYNFTVRCRVGSTDADAQQDVLLDLADWDEGLARVLEDDQTLNGLASSVSVTGPTGFRPYRGRGDMVQIGCEWSVNVIVAES